MHHNTHPTDASARPSHNHQQRENLFSRSSRLFTGTRAHWLRRLAPVFLLALLPMLATSAFAAAQFSTFSIGSKSYDATRDQSGPCWTWTASTNTLALSCIGDADYNYTFYETYIDGDIAFSTGNPAAVATIEVYDSDACISGNIFSQGKLLVTVINSNFIVGGNLGGSLEMWQGYVNVGGNIAGDLSVNYNSNSVMVGGNVGGNLTVDDDGYSPPAPCVTINGMVNGANIITSGVVKVNGSFIAGGPPAATANVTIPLNSLTPGVTTSGNGWNFSGDTLSVSGSSINYTLTGKAPTGIDVGVSACRSLTLDGATIDNTGASYPGEVLEISGNNLTVYIRNNNTIIGGIYCDVFGVLVLDAAAGATLNASGESGWWEASGITNYDGDLVLQGSGTFNFSGCDYMEDDSSGNGIDITGDLRLQNSVIVNAKAGNYTGNTSNSVGSCGVACNNLTIADHAKLTAAGGDASGVGGKGGYGVGLNAKLDVTSDASNALVASGGIGAVVAPLYGCGIAAIHSLQITGAGEIKATGDYAIASLYDITLAGCKITATADSSGYALYAAGYNNAAWTGADGLDAATFAGGTVNITAGTVTASNTAKPANIYYKYLNQTAGTYNGNVVDPNPKPDDHGGGGGGGAPSLLYLAATLALLGARATRPRK